MGKTKEHKLKGLNFFKNGYIFPIGTTTPTRDDGKLVIYVDAFFGIGVTTSTQNLNLKC